MSYSGVQPVYGTFPSDLFTGNGSNTVFTMSSVPGNDAALLVTVDGVRQHTDTYSYTANTLTFSEAPGSGAIIETVNMGSRADIIITEGVYKKTQFTATAAQTNFTIATGYTVGFVDVYLNGIRLVVADDFTATDGTTIILAAAAASGDAVEVVAYGTFNVANALLKSGDTMSGNLVVSGTTTMLSPVAIANTTGNTFVVANTGAVTITGTLTASANINFDSGTFFVDGTNNRVGINNAAPTSALTVTGAALLQVSNATSYTTSTRVGSGLTIYNSSNTNSYAGIELLTEPTTGNAGICGIAGLSTGSGDSALVFGTRGSATYAERMRIDSSGRVTMPYQPAFWVAKNNGTAATNTDIVWNDVKANRASGYNATNGRFTAPIAGYYFFSATGINVGTSNVLIELLLMLNGTNVSSGRGYYSGGTVGGATVTNLVNMAAGDYVTIQPSVTTMYGSESRCAFFSGYLIG